MSLAGDGSGDCVLSVAEARSCANDDGARHRGIRKGIHVGLGKRAESFGHGRPKIMK